VTGWLALGLVAVVALIVAAAATAPPVGLKASYFANATSGGAPERSTDFPWLTDATRIESDLNLHGEDFAVHFFNDAARFNFGPDVQPARDQLPFSVRWQGWLLAPSDGARRFLLEANGPARVTLDGVPLAGTDVTLPVGAGLHVLTVAYARPEAQVPSLTVSWQRIPGGALQAIGGDDVRWRPEAGSSALSSALDWIASALAGFSLGQADSLRRAMTTDRSYRRALPLSVALAELRAHRGSQFDPRVVDALLADGQAGGLEGDGAV